jgi:hypothetical protein
VKDAHDAEWAGWRASQNRNNADWEKWRAWQRQQ